MRPFHATELRKHAGDIIGEIPLFDTVAQESPTGEQIEIRERRHTPKPGRICHAFKQAGEHYEPIRVEVIGPGYAKWVYGPDDTDQLIKGSASDWARIVIRRAKTKDTRLKLTGEYAEKAVEVAKAWL